MEDDQEDRQEIEDKLKQKRERQARDGGFAGRRLKAEQAADAPLKLF